MIAVKMKLSINKQNVADKIAYYYCSNKNQEKLMTTTYPISHSFKASVPISRLLEELCSHLGRNKSQTIIFALECAFRSYGLSYGVIHND